MTCAVCGVARSALRVIDGGVYDICPGCDSAFTSADAIDEYLTRARDQRRIAREVLA